MHYKKLLIGSVGMVLSFSFYTIGYADTFPDIIPYQTELNFPSSNYESNTINIDSTHYNETQDFVIVSSDEPVFLFSNDSLTGIPIASMAHNASGYIIEEFDSCYLICSGEFSGYINKKLVITGCNGHEYAQTHLSKTVCVTTKLAYVFDTQDMKGNIIDLLTTNDSLELVNECDTSYKVKNDVFGIGYISKGNVYEGIAVYTATPCNIEEYYNLHPDALIQNHGLNETSEYENAFSYLRNQIVEYALQFLGNPYVWGGNDLENGIDCSGFVKEVFKKFGFELPRTSLELRSAGSEVCEGWSETLALPGDIVCYDGHVAIYIGNGMVVSAAGEKYGIRLSKADYREVLCVRRIVDFSEKQLNLKASEINILYRIVEAEAGNQGLKGKILVANVILNRVNSSLFPDNIKEVVFQQKDGKFQFQPVSNGKISVINVSEETKQAVELCLSGIDYSNGALYFLNKHYSDTKNISWFNSSLDFLFTYQQHEFYK